MILVALCIWLRKAGLIGAFARLEELAKKKLECETRFVLSCITNGIPIALRRRGTSGPSRAPVDIAPQCPARDVIVLKAGSDLQRSLRPRSPYPQSPPTAEHQQSLLIIGADLGPNYEGLAGPGRDA